MGALPKLVDKANNHSRHVVINAQHLKIKRIHACNTRNKNWEKHIFP